MFVSVASIEFFHLNNNNDIAKEANTNNIDIVYVITYLQNLLLGE